MPSRQRVSWAWFRVFAVAFVALTIFSVLLFLVTGGTFLEQKATLYLYIPDATGLGAGSPVRVDGIGVGTVKSVGLSGSADPNRVVRVTIAIDRDRLASIPADSTTGLSTETLIGDQYVDIDSGRSPQHIQPGAELIYKPGSLMKTLDLRQFEQQLRKVDALLTDIETGKSRVGQFILGEQMYDSLKKRVGQMLGDIQTATSMDTQVGKALYSDEMYRQISEPLAKLDRTLAQMQSGQGTSGRLLTDSAQYEQMRDAIQNFAKTVEDVHASPFIQSDTSYEQWNRMLAGFVQGVENLNADPLMAASDTYDRVTGAARSLQEGLRDLRRDPGKFLRLKVF